MPREPAELLESTGYLLARVGSESRRRFVEALARHKLTLAAYSVLMILGGVGDSTQRQLADAVGIDPRNLVPILDDLEKRGHVMRAANPSDRRRHAVRLSPAGRTQLARLAQTGAAAELQLLRPLTHASAGSCTPSSPDCCPICARIRPSRQASRRRSSWPTASIG